MALWDLLQGIVKPIQAVGQTVGDLAESQIPGAGKFGERLHTVVPMSIAQDVADIMPYAATMGLDNEKLPQILAQLRQDRATAQAKAQKAEMDATEKFFSTANLNILPGALPSVHALAKTPGIKPDDLIAKAVAANYAAPKPVTPSIVYSSERDKLTDDYIKLPPLELKKKYQDPSLTRIQREAIKEVGKLTGVELLSQEQEAAVKEKKAKEAKKEASETPKKEWGAFVEAQPIGTIMFDGVDFKAKNALGSSVKLDPFSVEVTNAIKSGSVKPYKDAQIPYATFGIKPPDKYKSVYLNELYSKATPSDRAKLEKVLARVGGNEEEAIKLIQSYNKGK
jgi:hypothetical protein